MSPINTLSADVIDMIVEIVACTASESSLSSLALANSMFLPAVRHRQHRFFKPNLSLNNIAISHSRLFSIESSGLLSAIQKIELDGRQIGEYAATGAWRFDSEELEDFFSTLSRLLPCMTGLRDLVCTANAFPAQIMATLVTLPGVRLHVELVETRDPQSDESNLLSLSHLDSLHSLLVTVVDANEQPDAFKSLGAVVASCRNLRNLDVAVQDLMNGQFPEMSWNGYMGSMSWSESDCPSLERLTLVGRGMSALPRNVQDPSWVSKCNWTALKSLRIWDVNFFRDVKPEFSALREVSIEQVELNEDVERFFYELPTMLEAVRLPQIPTSLASAMALRHGQSLRKLILSDERGHKRSIDFARLVLIRGCFPLLAELGVDLPRGVDGTWPYAHLDVLSSFEKMSHLTIEFSLEFQEVRPGRNSGRGRGRGRGRGGFPPASTRPHNSFARPFVTYAGALHIFTYLLDRGPRCLESATIGSGPRRDPKVSRPTSHWTGTFWVPWTAWLESQSVKFECRRDGYDPNSNFPCSTSFGGVNIRCTDLIATFNKSLEHGVLQLPEPWPPVSLRVPKTESDQGVGLGSAWEQDGFQHELAQTRWLAFSKQQRELFHLAAHGPIQQEELEKESLTPSRRDF